MMNETVQRDVNERGIPRDQKQMVEHPGDHTNLPVETSLKSHADTKAHSWPKS